MKVDVEPSARRPEDGPGPAVPRSHGRRSVLAWLTLPALGAACYAPTRRALAQATVHAFPERTVKIIVGQTPGSTADTIGRIAADALSAYWDAPVVVENHSGAGGAIAAEMVATTTADGYMLLLGNVSNLVVTSAYGDPNLRYGALTDFTPLGRIARTPFYIVARGGLEVSSIPQLVAMAKAAPGRLTYVTYGTYTLSRAAFDLLSNMAGIELTEIPYRGAAPAMTDLLAGRVDLGVFEYASARANIEAGRLRVLGAIDAHAGAAAPAVPTVAEQGLPGYAVEAWYGLLAPDSLPPAVEKRLVEALRDVRRSAAMRQRIAQFAYESVQDDPAQFAATIRAEIEMYRRHMRHPQAAR
jgi:tripartite-type tricarboxylate transporter receptor subunit TctC